MKAMDAWARVLQECDLHWVTPRLALGARLPSRGAATLRNLGISRVVDVRIEECDDERALAAHGIVLLHLPTLDRCAIAQDKLTDGAAWVNEQLAGGHKVYVHCEHGIGRSALLVCCVLVSQGLSPAEALRTAKNARAKVSPSPEQLEALLRWSRAFRHAARLQPTGETLEQLGRIAWSNG